MSAQVVAVMACEGLVDEAKVTVDVAMLERAAQPAPLLVVALGLALVGLGLALWAAPEGQRWWAALHLLFTPLGAGLGAVATNTPPAFAFDCLAAPVRPASHFVAIGAGLAALAFVQVALSLTLRAWKPGPRRVRWALACLGLAFVTAGGVALHKHALLREFSTRVAAVLPVPNLRPKGEAVAHLGQTVQYEPEVQAAGARQGLFFPSRVLMTADAARAWQVERVALTPRVPGVADVPLHLVRDLVTVDVTVQVTGVEDRGPSFFPLAVGNRFELVGARGRGGTAATLERQWQRGKKAVPAPTVTLEVTGDEVRDGLHVFVLTVTRGDEVTTERVVRRDGTLTRDTGAVLAVRDERGCRVNLLTPSYCQCTDARVVRCVDTSGDLGESLLRGFLAVVTLGMTEFSRGGMGDLGAGNETAVVMTRWRVDGVEGSIVGGR